MRPARQRAVVSYARHPQPRRAPCSAHQRNLELSKIEAGRFRCAWRGRCNEERTAARAHRPARSSMPHHEDRLPDSPVVLNRKERVQAGDDKLLFKRSISRRRTARHARSALHDASSSPSATPASARREGQQWRWRVGQSAASHRKSEGPARPAIVEGIGRMAARSNKRAHQGTSVVVRFTNHRPSRRCGIRACTQNCGGRPVIVPRPSRGVLTMPERMARSLRTGCQRADN